MIVLETDRLLLRRLTREDLDDLVRLYADSETMRFFGGPRSRKEAEAEMTWCLEQYERNVTTGGCGPAFWATILKSDNAFIGRCGLLPQVIEDKAEAEVAYMIARSHWNQGLGTEVARAIKEWGFRHYKFPRLISTIVPGNTASIRVAEKNGLHYKKDVEVEGILHHLYSVARISPREMD
jgi:[ribosomal protein S5]-alanine N-acetyltransferase